MHRKFLQLLSNCIVISAIGTLAACASQPRLRVQSDPPNIPVYASSPGKPERKMIGTTPFEISFEELYMKTGATRNPSDFFTFHFDAKETEPENLLVPTAAFGANLVNVQAKLSPRKEKVSANAILQHLHNAQKFARAAQLERAMLETERALEIDPNFVRSLAMKGSLYYFQKNYDEALKWFERALAIDNSFDEAIQMIAKIKQERK